MADALVIGLCALRAARAPDPLRRRFWRLLAAAFPVIAVSYAATGLARLGAGGPLELLGLVSLLAAYPILLAALGVRAVQEEGVQSGLATSMDIGILITALLAACVPTLVLPILPLGTTAALTSGISWAANVGLFAGGLWVLYRLPPHRRAGGVALLVAALGLFSGLSLSELIVQAHRIAVPWEVALGYGLCWLLVAGAPARDVPLAALAPQPGRGPQFWRALLPALALCPLVGLWGVTLARGWDGRGLGTAIIVVAALALGRQILLLREHQVVLGQERSHVRELTLMQEVARTLASTLDLDAVLAEVARACAQMVSPPGSDQRIATILRLEGDEVVSVVQHDETGSNRFAGRRYALSTHPVLASALRSASMQSGRISGTHMDADTQRSVGEAHIDSYIVAPLHIGGSPFGLLTVSARDRRGFDAVQRQRIGGLASLAELAISNALSYERQRDEASTDPLTRLRNRREFERRLGALPRTGFAVLAIDVDNLKTVNDEYGHEAGDEILRAVGRTLSALVRAGDVLARVGGDEFAALLIGADAVEAQAVAERMQRAMHGTSVSRGLPRISVGYAAGGAGADAATVWRVADEALFRAKRVGRDRVEGMNGTSASVPMSTRSLWAELLGSLLERRTVEAAFQPIVRLQGRAVIGYEALARPPATAPDGDMEELFATAKTLGMLRDLDWLCRRAALAGASGLPPRSLLFVNISSAALLDPVHQVDQMLLLCRWAGRDPSGVVLEITEREPVSDLGRLRGVLASYREQGFRFAVDDVGDGHSTLEVLTAAMPDFVKIARGLVAAATGPGARAAVRATVEFARSTGSAVIAEGVETEEQVDLLLSLGVELGQGWHLGRPIREPVIEALAELRPAV